MPSTRVLVVDDEALMRRLIVRRLQQEPDIQVVGEAENGREAVELSRTEAPDVVLMDLQMPVMNGALATQRIVSQRPHIRVVMLTALGELADIGRVHGAVMCLDKSCTPEELIQAIRSAADRTAKAPPPDSSDYVSTVDRISVRMGLTDREKMVVRQAVNTDMTIRQMATALSAQQGELVSESSVKHALERAMTKLMIEPRTRSALVKHVLEFAQRSS